MSEFDPSAVLRRIRRAADLSQRELGERLGVPKSTVAAAEAGSRDLRAGPLARAATVAGLRLALLDPQGCEVPGMAADAVRDRAGRRFPAHLDTRHGDEGWWHGEYRYSREQPWYTFDRVRYTRDYWRDRLGTPADHQLPGPDDDPRERLAARQAETRRRRRDEWERRRAAGKLINVPDFTCACPPACDVLDDWSGKPVHGDDCACGCDVG